MKEKNFKRASRLRKVLAKNNSNQKKAAEEVGLSKMQGSRFVYGQQKSPKLSQYFFEKFGVIA